MTLNAGLLWPTEPNYCIEDRSPRKAEAVNDERCEWADTIGDGLHVDMTNASDEGPWTATCCDVGEITGPEGDSVSPVSS